jgi:DNA-binding XRE family transcriptional regulator
MKLKEYRLKRELSRAKAGAEIGVCGVTLYRYETGRAVPSTTTMRRIMQWSGGEVSADDLIAPATEREAAE